MRTCVRADLPCSVAHMERLAFILCPAPVHPPFARWRPLPRHGMVARMIDNVTKQREDKQDRWRLYFAAGAFVLSLLGILGCLVHGATVEPVVPPVVAYDGPPEAWATDAPDPDAGPVIGRPMPEKPIKGQKRPDGRGRCSEDETLINGACWMELVRKPGTDNCGAKGFHYDGRCYVPVQQAPRTPTSVEP